MTKAEADDVSNKLGDLREDFDSLKKLVENSNNSLADISKTLESLNTTLTQKIDDGNAKLSKEIQRIETSFNTELIGLKAADDEIRQTIKELDVNTSKNINDLEKHVGDVQAKIDDKQRQLDASNSIIKSQTAQIVRLEEECHRGLQHGRGWNIEIDGVPTEVGDDPEDLRCAFLSICETFNISVFDIDIETIHRLPSRQSPKPVIVRFISRETAREIHNKKLRLKDLCDRVDGMDIAGLTADSKIYIRPSLCSYYRCLAFNCRALKRNKLLTRVYVSDDGKISIRLLDGSIVKVSHESTLLKYFPNFQNFNFKYNERDSDS